jgi:drug/metabolite transporter (DMT)-like permease
MFHYLWPILVVIGANTFYNITAKSTPVNVNLFASLTITYLVAAALSLALFFTTAHSKNIFVEWGNANWTAIAFGLSILGLEFGYINVYRVGWKVSTGSLVANIGLACVLLLVGILFYKEAISVRQIVGMAICAVGLVLITK